MTAAHERGGALNIALAVISFCHSYDYLSISHLLKVHRSLPRRCALRCADRIADPLADPRADHPCVQAVLLLSLSICLPYCGANGASKRALVPFTTTSLHVLPENRRTHRDP